MRVITTAIAPETVSQLQACYMEIQQQLGTDPTQADPAWREALSQLSSISFGDGITPDDFVRANSFVSVLQQCLVAAAARTTAFGQ